MELRIKKKECIEGTVRVPGDKSISHRSIMLASLAKGVTRIKGFLMSEDCLATIGCFKSMGIKIEVEPKKVLVHGKGLDGLREPQDVLDIGNSGTTIRLLAGILAGQPFTAIVTGDQSIRRRPMGRITTPLQKMGATILGRQHGELAPLAISGGGLMPISYKTPVASAQIKSSILLAGLFADGRTEVIEPAGSRDHTERMLTYLGAEVAVSDLAVSVCGLPQLIGKEVDVPGDISSAAFLLVATAIAAKGQLTIKDVGINPTRTGIIDVLREMGAGIEVKNIRDSNVEPIADLVVTASKLKGVRVGGEMIPRLVDEIPVLAVAAACADGITEIRDAAELKLKESNRLSAICQGLAKMGANVQELPDGLRIRGGTGLSGATLDSAHDHRIAMALAVAATAAQGETIITNAKVIDVSFPGFGDLLASL